MIIIFSIKYYNMKSKILFFVAILFAFSSSFAQNNPSKLVSSTENETVLNFDLTSYNFDDVLTNNGIAKLISAENTTPILKKGMPDLPKFTSSLIIPDKSLMKVKIISSNFIEIKDINIAPSKGNLTRDINPNDVAYEYGKAYTKDAFYPSNIAVLNDAYIMRDYRGQALQVTPFQYNPVTRTLRIYTNIQVKVYADGEGGQNIFDRKNAITSTTKEFNEIYKNRFVNYSNFTKYTVVEEEGNMLIICHDDFMEEMADFVTWKNTIGRPTEIVAVSTIGTTATAIGTYVDTYYNDNGLAYLLLVGDAAQIPTNSGGGLGGDSDNAYAYILGNDHYLEFFVGRFSAETEAHVTTQVQRTITYENGSTLTDGWLNKTMGVASDQGPGDDNEYDYEHYRNLATDLLGFTYNESLELFDGSQGGNDASGSPTATMVGTDINNGVGIINYTGHGSDFSWASSGFSVSNINTLTNDNMLPFIWSVACVNGNFVGQTCFGEAWLRASNGDNPTGAIAIMASTINQSWAPPMAAQDEMVDILVESYANNIKRTFAGLAINGCFLMNDETSDFAMTDTWTCFGDPSLMVRTDDTQDMAITHQGNILMGQTSFDIGSDFDGGFACLSKDGVIIGTATVTGGTASIPLADLTPGDVLTLAVTGFNKTTFLDEEITVIAPDGPYVVLDNYSISGTQSLDFGQTGNIQIILKNIGPDMANGVTATLTTSDAYVSSISNNTDISFGNIAGDNATATVSGKFTITLTNDVPDGHSISFDLEITGTAKEIWTNSLNIIANAPVFTSELAGVNDNSSEVAFTSSPVTEVAEGSLYSYNVVVAGNAGNGNNSLDPGETANVTFNATNIGHADLLNSISSLSSTSEYITINNNDLDTETFSVDEELQITFNITVSETTPVGEIIDLTLNITGDSEYTISNTINLKVGLIVEDFETGDFTAFDWNLGGNANWATTTTSPYEGTYSAVSGNISDDQTSELSLTANVLADDQISFFAKVSSESNWDFLRFYIDGSMQEEWSGEVAWAEHTYDVTAGNHTFKWAYEKDGSQDGGTDQGWIDNIIFPAMGMAKTKDATSITGVEIPSWLTLTDNGDGTANLEGTSPNEGGFHNVILQAQAAGDAVTQEFTVTVGMISVEDIANNFEIYPNPSNGNFYISKNNMEVNTVEIYNVSGQIIYSSIISTKNNEIKLNNIAPGMYLINIISNETIITKKLMVK